MGDPTLTSASLVYAVFYVIGSMQCTRRERGSLSFLTRKNAAPEGFSLVLLLAAVCA
jgi:hypothetical protein